MTEVPPLHPIHRRLLAEEVTRRRPAKERRRFAAAQRRGRIDPNPHQIDAVVFALQRIQEGGCILADEVGLGKTIEAGLIIAQLLAEGAERILIIVPKPLVGQWQSELWSLFALDAHLGAADPESFEGEGVFLTHREFAGGVKGSAILSSVDDFDLVVIDEAHEFFSSIYRRFDKHGDYQPDSSHAQIAGRVRDLVRRSATPVLLLTATPLQNSLSELWGLAQFVDPTGTLLGRLPVFRAVFCDDKDQRVVSGLEDELQRRLKAILQRTLRRQADEFLEVKFAPRTARVIEYAMSAEERALYNDVTDWLLDPSSLAFDLASRQLLLIGFHRRMASSLRALSTSLDRVAERLEKQAAGRGDGDLADWIARELRVELDDEDSLPELEPPKQTEGGRPRTLDDELALVRAFSERAKALPHDGKAKGLLETVEDLIEAEGGNSSGKVVIFTESLVTQEYLRELLLEHGLAEQDVTLFRGANDSPRAREALRVWEEEVGAQLRADQRPAPDIAVRLALVHEFRTRSKVFISTEAGAKGLNLQFCEKLINYDLPWNPQRIEQRIGRVHRYGQRRPVEVINLVAAGNETQALVFEILSRKLSLFGSVLDASDPVLQAEKEHAPESLVSAVGYDLEDRIRRIYESSTNVKDVNEQLRSLRDDLEARRERFGEAQARAEELVVTNLDEQVRQVFVGYQQEVSEGLKELDRDLDCLIHGFLLAVGVEFERQASGSSIRYNIGPSPLLPDSMQNGASVVAGPGNATEDDTLHPAHDLVRAAVEEASEAGDQCEGVVFGAPSEPAHAVLSGSRGRIIVARVSHRGLEPCDNLIRVATIEGRDEPLDSAQTDALLQLPVVDDLAPQQMDAADTLAENALEEAVLDDTDRVNATDEERFQKSLFQLGRFVDDQVLVLKRQLSRIERKLREENKKRQGAVSQSKATAAEKQITALEKQVEAATERIAVLQQGDDPDFLQWRSRLYSRRYAAPHVTRVLDFHFQVGSC